MNAPEDREAQSPIICGDFTYVVAGTPEAAIACWSAETLALVDEYEARETNTQTVGAR